MELRARRMNQALTETGHPTTTIYSRLYSTIAESFVRPHEMAKHLELARDKLNPNNLDSGLPGRDSQIEDIHNFLYQRLKIKSTTAEKRTRVESGQVANIKRRHNNKTIFICGVPGTGKTASVNFVIDRLRKLSNKSSRKSQIEPMENFVVININAQNLTSPDRIYSEIYYKLVNKQAAPEKAQEGLEKIFRPTDTSRRKDASLLSSYKIIVVDELDLLYSERREDIFYNLFDWPTISESKVILIAIANAMDLPERIQSKIASRLGWEKLVFEPYKSDNLENILKVRLGEDLLYKSFDKAAISIATKRIGRTTGDARRILDVCRLALGSAIRRKLSKVDAKIIDEVGFDKLDFMKRDYLETCGPFHLTALKAILLTSINDGGENIEVFPVIRQFQNLLDLHPEPGLNIISLEEIQAILNDLSAVGLIYLEPDKPMLKKRTYLKDSSDITKDLIKKLPISRSS